MQQNQLKICVVCADDAVGVNFNALTCVSCKVFFRRNALRDRQADCLFDNSCTINKNTRKFCAKCRLAKCLLVGMKTELIKSDTEQQRIQQKLQRKLRRSLKRQKVEMALSDEDCKVNLIQNKTTNSKLNEQNLFSNIEKYCDILLQSENFIEDLQSLELVSTIDNFAQTNVSIEPQPKLPLIHLPAFPHREFILPEKYLLKELIDACSVLQNPYNQFGDFHECNHVHSDQITHYFFRRVTRMCKRLGCFGQLTPNDQKLILNGNSVDLLSLRSVLMFIPDRQAWAFMDDKCKVSLLVSAEMVRSIISPSSYEKSTIYYQHLLEHLRHEWIQDNVIFDLLTAIVMFNPRVDFEQYDKIKEEHDRYQSLLRRYLQIIYPTHAEANDSFQELMQNLAMVWLMNGDVSDFLQADEKPLPNMKLFFDQI